MATEQRMEKAPFLGGMLLATYFCMDWFLPQDLQATLWNARKAILRLMNWQSHKEILGALFQSSKGPSWAF